MRRMIQDTLTKAITENTKLMNNTIDQLSAILSNVDSEREKLNAEIVSFEQLKKLNQDESKAQIHHLSSQLESKDEIIKTLEQKINQANESIVEKDKVIESFKLKVNDAEECFEKNKKAHSELMDEFKEFETKYYQRGKEMSSLVHKIGKLEVELSKTTESLESVQSKIVTLSNDLLKKEEIINLEKKKFENLELEHNNQSRQSFAEISDLKEKLVRSSLAYDEISQEYTARTYHYERLLKDLQNEIDRIKEQSFDNINETVSVSITRGKDGNLVITSIQDKNEDKDGSGQTLGHNPGLESYSPKEGLVMISPHLNQRVIYDTMVGLINQRIDKEQFPIVEMGIDSNQNVHYIRTSNKFIATKLVLLTGLKFDRVDELIKITYVEDGHIPSCYTVITPDFDSLDEDDDDEISEDKSGQSSPKEDIPKSWIEEDSESSSSERTFGFIPETQIRQQDEGNKQELDEELPVTNVESGDEAEKYKYFALPSRCYTCESRQTCNAVWSISCYECYSETKGQGYNIDDIKDKTSSCEFCKYWVPHTSELAQKQTTYGQFDRKSSSIESLQHGGLEFYLSRQSSHYHICGSRDGQWTYRNNTVLVRPHVYKGRNTDEILSNFDNKIIPKKDENVVTDVGITKVDIKERTKKLPKEQSKVEKTTEDEGSPVVIIEEKIDDDDGDSQGSVDITLLCDLDDSDLLDELKKDLRYLEDTDERINEGSFDGGEFYDRKTITASSAFGLHFKEGNRHVQTDLTRWFDSFCGSDWTMYKMRSGLGPRSVSMKCEIIDGTLYINHLGLFKMMSNIDGTLGIENEGLRSDLETIVPTLADIKIFMKWTKYQYSISTFSLDRMKSLFGGAFNSPQWSIGNVKCPLFNEKEGRVNFSPKVYKARIFTYDPILAGLTGITLNVSTYLSDSGVYTSVKLTRGLKETLTAAKINLVNVEHTSEDKNGIILHHISTKNGVPLNQHAQKITIIEGTGSDVNYSSFGQICYPPNVKFVRVTGLFAFVATGGISSKPHTLTYRTLPEVIDEVSKEKFNLYLKHLSEIRNHLTGPQVQMTITKRQVFIDNVQVDDLKQYSSSSLVTEFAMCKGCIYHPSNRNFCSKCRINFICAVNCGKHDGEVPSNEKDQQSRSSE